MLYINLTVRVYWTTLKTGKDFRDLVWKRVWKITFFGLKTGQDLKNRAAHPHQEFPGVPPPPESNFIWPLIDTTLKQHKSKGFHDF